MIHALTIAAAFAAPAPPEPGYFPPEFATTLVTCDRRISRDGRPGRQPVLTDFQSQWYSSHLRAAREPSLSHEARGRRPPGAASLRFILLRSFDRPVIIRVETARGRARLVARELSGAGGYSPGQVARRLDRPLTAAEARALRDLLARTRPFAEPPRLCQMGLDGAQWIFEAVDAGGYHFLDRWSPEDGAARQLGVFLMGLTGWRFGSVY
jgi:hypothetical protein